MSYVEFPQEWSERVRDARLSRHLSVAALVKRVRVSRKTYEKIERHDTGRCRDSTWRDVCVALGLWEQWKRRPGLAGVADIAMSPKIDSSSLAGTLKADVFLAAAMESADAVGRTQATADAIVVLREIRKLNLSVFFAGEERPESERYEDQAWALVLNDDLIRRASRFVMLWPAPQSGSRKPPASSALIELGMAVAWRIPVLVLHRGELSTLPFMLQRVDSAFSSFHLVRYRDDGDLRNAIRFVYRSFLETAPSSSGALL